MTDHSKEGPLRAGQLATLAAVAEALIPSGGEFPLGAADVGVAGRLNRYLRDFNSSTRRQIGWLLAAWELSPLLSRHLKPFSQLSASARAAYVEEAAASRYPWRHIPVGLLKQLCGVAYGAAPEVEAALGFTHSCIHATPPEPGVRLAPIAFPQIKGNVNERADVCIIGSGAGGAVVAKELAETGRSVLIIEEGGYFTQDDFHGAPFERVLRTYRDQATTMAYGRPMVALPLGKAVGGTTVINSGTCFRTPDKVLRRWESEYGLTGFDSATLAPIFDNIEMLLNVMPVPWDIIGKNAEILDRGVRALGLHGEPIRRCIRGCRGCGVCALGCPSDAKQSMPLSYLPRAAAHGARIFALCRAHRILIANGRATGVEADILDAADTVRGRLTVRADAVVVAAGSIHTPLLLRANGVGARSGQLGRNLRVHPAVGVSAEFDEDIYSWRGTLQSYFVDHLMESDEVMLEATSIIPGMGLAFDKSVGADAKRMMANYHRLATTGLFVSDSSSGRLMQWRNNSRPIILYSLNQRDAQRLLRGMAFAAEIFFAAGARKVYLRLPGLREVSDTAGLAPLRSDNQWQPSALTLTGFHPMGTCRMGPRPESSVVNLRGETHDVQRLFVADGSLFPTCAGVNPQLSIMAFATRIAQQIATI